MKQKKVERCERLLAQGRADGLHTLTRAERRQVRKTLARAAGRAYTLPGHQNGVRPKDVVPPEFVRLDAVSIEVVSLDHHAPQEEAAAREAAPQ